MERDKVYARIFESLFKKWHWFNWHFELTLRGMEHPLCRSFVDACLDCERVVPGFAFNMSDRMTSISGREKFEPHYEQLLQLLAELHVLRQILTFEWGDQVKFHWEPTAGSSKKNPELLVEHPDSAIGVEVKCPALLDHVRKRGTNTLQLPSRSDLLSLAAKSTADTLRELEAEIPTETLSRITSEITLPRDNPVKDFLISANEKFAPFKREYLNFYGLLVIVWDDYIFEPISALLSLFTGLFTENSFYKDQAGYPVKFKNVDGIVLIRHLHQIVNAAADRPLLYNCKHALDYGKESLFPWKVLIENPNGAPIASDPLQRCLQTCPLSDALGSEYIPQDFIYWFDSSRYKAS
jgi:hypothetical protein